MDEFYEYLGEHGIEILTDGEEKMMMMMTQTEKKTKKKKSLI